jgi:PST family polysaccharide transporter
MKTEEKGWSDSGSRREPLVGMTVGLYVTQFATFLLPAVTLPYLTRVLGVNAWGELAFLQSFGSFLGVFIEYGFSFSGTQQVAQARRQKDALAEVLGSVQGAKLLLSAAAVGICLAIRGFVPKLLVSDQLFWAAIGWSVAQSFNLNWFFLGMERIFVPVLVDLVARGVAAASLFVIIRSPQDAWKVLGVQAVAAFVSAVVCWRIALRTVPLGRFSAKGIANAFRRGWAAMLFRAAESTYTAGAPMLLGFLRDGRSVGLLSGAEKIMRCILILLEPVQRALYARVTSKLCVSSEVAGRLVRRSALWIFLAASVMSAVTFAAAGPLLSILFGPEFSQATPILRILCFIPPAVAMKWSIGLHWMMPGALRRQFSFIVAGSCLLHIALTLWLASVWGAVGMAITMVVVEFAIPLTCYMVVRTSAANPFVKDHSIGGLPQNSL